MGIRIHKMLGYGLTNVQTEGYYLNDPRFNPEGIMSRDIRDYQDEEKFSAQKYIDWLQRKYDALEEEHGDREIDAVSRKIDYGWEIDAVNRHINGRNHWDVHSSFVHEIEYGIPNVFCIVPPMSYDQWYRYDDMLETGKSFSSL
jgi:hypothetical protein